MHRRSAAAGILLAVALLIAGAPQARANSLLSERLLVTFKDSSSAANALQRLGGTRVGPNGWAGVGDPSLVSGLVGVASVAPDGIMRAANTPNDPCVSTCDSGKTQWYLPVISAPSAWDRTLGAGVTVAILDSGIDVTHPDLASKVVGSVNLTDEPLAAVGAHGTEVAGVAGAATNNGIGVASVGWSVGLLNVKVLDSQGEGFTSAVINGIFEAVNRGAKVINLSLASTVYEQPLQDAINFAYDHGVLVVAAAGNNDDQGGNATDPKYPAAMNHVLSVGATLQNDSIAPFSRRGPTVDMVAPGNALYTTAAGGGYTIASGTSLASPLVAASAALLIAQGLDVSPDQVSAQLVRTGQPLNNGSGGVLRRLNVGFATETVAPYGYGYGGGDSVAVGELDGSSPGQEIVTGAGPGGGSHVKIYSAAMNPLNGGWFAYGNTFHGGVDVAVGDVLPDASGDEIVTGAGPGGGPHVRTFLANGQPAPGQPGDGFFAYGPGFKGGVSVAVGDVRPDITGDEIVTGALSDGGPHIRVFTASGELLDEFFAFDPNFHGGVQVAVGQFDSASGAEIAVGAGPGAGPHVKMFHADGTALSGGFYAYAADFGGGVDVAAAPIGGGFDELITVPRSYGGPHLRAFNVSGAPISGGVFAYDGAFGSGLSVAAGATEIVVGMRAGPTLTRAFPLSAVL